MAELELAFLGSPQVERNGTILEIRASKALALLAYLTITGQNQSRDTLGTLLWPESDQSRARTYLRHTLWTLKNELGEEWLNISREQIGFKANADVWLDVQAFQDAISTEAAHDHADGRMCEQCLKQLQQAVSLYRDDFLAGFTLTDSPAFDEWQFFQVESLRQMLAGALERLVQDYMARQAYDSAIPLARRWLALDTLHEPVHRILMRLYALDGQQAAALRQYQECQRLLEEELGVEPEEETTALFETIRARQLKPPVAVRIQEKAPQAAAFLTDLTSPQPVDGDTSLPVPVEVPPFVAREKELERLEAILKVALHGRPRVAFVLGEAGQGKTALLQAFAGRAQEMVPSLIVAGGNCNAYTGLGDPYLPFREILSYLTADLEAQALLGVLTPEQAQRVQQLLPETARTLVETAPDLIDTFVSLAGLLERTADPRLSGAPWRQQLLNRAASKLPGTEADLQQSALLEQYARLLQEIARRAPLLLTLDDLQWADLGSVNLLFHLGRRLSGHPILIVGAYRPDEVAMRQDGEPHPLARVVDELQRVFGDISLDLGKAEGQKFIDDWLDRESNQLQAFFRQTLYRQTGGHPLFTIELLRAMQDRGDLWQDEEGVWQSNTNFNWNTMPARVEGAIGERIKRLDPSLQELLQVASVEGEEFTAEVAARVLHLDEIEAVRRFSRELDKVYVLVRAVGSRRVGGRRLSRYRFRHILIQRYLYKSLDDVERVYQHEAVGRALEELHAKQLPGVAVQLARHFEIAKLPAKAAVYLQMAGDQARRTAALREALGFYQAALDHWPQDDESGRAALLRKLGECQWMTGDAGAALATLEAGYSLFETRGDIEQGGAMQRLIGRVYWEIGDRANSMRHYQQALSLLEPLTDSVELAWAISSISQMHMIASEHEKAIAWGERALALARRLKAEPVIVHALNNVGTAHMNLVQLEQGQAMLQESIRRAKDGNLPHDACRGQLNLGEGLASTDHYDEARVTFETLYDHADRAHTTLYASSSLIELNRVDWLTGRWRDALERQPLIQEWLERSQSMVYSRVIASTVFGLQFNDLGQPEAANRTLVGNLDNMYGFDELQLTSPHLAQLVRALANRGEEEETMQVARELLALCGDHDYNSRYTAYSLLAVCNSLSHSAAAELLDRIMTALEALDRDGTVDQVASRSAARHEAWGVVASFRQQPNRAIESYRRAIEAWQTIDRPYDQARALAKLGQVLALHGGEEEASIAFTRANERVEELAEQLDDVETKAIFLRSPLVQAIQNGLQTLDS